MKVEFQVAMNAEEKALKNLHKVELEVEKADDATMLKYALKAYVVEIQGQIRNNWAAFIKGDYPKELVIGQAMFVKRAKEDYKTTLMSKPMVQRLKVLLDEGMIDVDMYEASIEKLFDRGEITEDEMTEALDI